MKKLLSVVSLLMALMMLCTCALANEQKYDEPVTVHFVRSTDETLNAALERLADIRKKLPKE